MKRLRPAPFVLNVLFVAWLVPAATQARPGEHWYATAALGLRQEPHRGAHVVTTIEAGQELIEIAHEGRWLQVGVLGGGVTGWVHSAFVEKAQPPRGPLIHPLIKFKPALEMFNRVRAERGGVVFSGAEYLGNGILALTVAATWFSHPAGQRQADIDNLYRIWKAANDQRPVAVYISDPEKAHELEILDPELPTLHR